MIDQFTCRLGFICTSLGNQQDADLTSDTQSLYNWLDSKSKCYRCDDPETIRMKYADNLAEQAGIILEPFGARLWSAVGGPRPGLLSAGDQRVNGLYPSDLYWNNLGDQAH